MRCEKAFLFSKKLDKMLEEGIQRMKMKAIQIQDSLILKEREKWKVNNDRSYQMDKIHMEKMYLTSERRIGKWSRTAGLTYFVAPQAIQNNNAINTKLRILKDIDVDKHITVQIPSTRLNNINKKVQIYSSGACLSRRKMKIKPRFYSRNRSLQTLASRIDILTVAETLTSASILKFLTKTNTKLYVIKIIERNIQRSIANVCSKILISKLIPNILLRYKEEKMDGKKDEKNCKLKFGTQIKRIERDILKDLYEK